ncbi:hypothetical protein CNYM01_05341 [Colletotrichum nymphaeae SA-01]|uniref:Uncharacterized protein n=1 Tax=Colletotrichum nymphaeae SA-01 TaxID=1460502 RepID=A0A135TCE5_9PEZI|nr:hypothetical protein CNYM01_05341 [Colletotrichum nymphaeae SA-01]
MANDKKCASGLKGPNAGTSSPSTTAQRFLLKHELILGYENDNVPAGKTYHEIPLDSERVVRKSGGSMYNGICHVPIWGGKASHAHENRPRFAYGIGHQIDGYVWDAVAYNVQSTIISQ